MNLAIRAGFFHPFAEPVKHLSAINAFATVKAIHALEQLGFQFLECPRSLGQTHGLVLLQASETGTNNFTGRLIQTAFDFFFHKLCQFRRQ